MYLACEQAHLFGVSREYLGGEAVKPWHGEAMALARETQIVEPARRLECIRTCVWCDKKRCRPAAAQGRLFGVLTLNCTLIITHFSINVKNTVSVFLLSCLRELRESNPCFSLKCRGEIKNREGSRD